DVDADASAQVQTERAHEKTSQHTGGTSAADSTTERSSSTDRLAEAFSKGYSHDLQTAVASTWNTKEQHGWGDAHKKAESARNALAAARDRRAVTGAKMEMASNELAANIKNKSLANQKIEDAVAHLSPEQQNIYHEKFAASEAFLGIHGFTEQSNSDVYLAKRLEALHASGKEGEAAMWHIANEAGMSAASNVSGGLADNIKFRELETNGAGTDKNASAATANTGATADRAASNRGPSEYVNPKDHELDRSIIKLKTDHEQTVQPQDPSQVPSPKFKP
ncbi:MAG: hypothetical protein K2X81_26010, partial [Candidatus Obscuribacterales bacterium]|nr:hypothetical protein [Candidatus Obscuribacterales bacterium]